MDFKEIFWKHKFYVDVYYDGELMCEIECDEDEDKAQEVFDTLNVYSGASKFIVQYFYEWNKVRQEYDYVKNEVLRKETK